MTKKQRMLGLKVRALEKKIATAAMERMELRSKCKHPKGSLYKRYGSNTGNYDPSADCYWIDFFCRLCGHYFTQNDQSKTDERDRAIEVPRKHAEHYSDPFPEMFTAKELLND